MAYEKESQRNRPVTEGRIRQAFQDIQGLRQRGAISDEDLWQYRKTLSNGSRGAQFDAVGEIEKLLEKSPSHRGGASRKRGRYRHRGGYSGSSYDYSYR